MYTYKIQEFNLCMHVATERIFKLHFAYSEFYESILFLYLTHFGQQKRTCKHGLGKFPTYLDLN